jgi:hypothetical protein
VLKNGEIMGGKKVKRVALKMFKAVRALFSLLLTYCVCVLFISLPLCPSHNAGGDTGYDGGPGCEFGYEFLIYYGYGYGYGYGY